MVDLEKLKNVAREAVSRDDVKYLIGWRQGTFGFRVAPHFVKDPEEADELTFSPLCNTNPATYLALRKTEKVPLPKGEEPDTRKVALMVKGCDSRAVVQQIVEQGISREDVYLIGCPCEGVVDLNKVEEKISPELDNVEASWDGDHIVFQLPQGEEKVKKEEVLASNCLECRYPNPPLYDTLLWDSVEPWGNAAFEDIQEMEEKDPEEKWAFWEEKLSSCIRCYSCRNVCPMCYCEECVLGRLNPAWILRSVNEAENTAYHLSRAYHLAGRCVECGECERVCPVNIPLMKLNRKLSKEVLQNYNYEPGIDPEAKPMQASYHPDDKEDFIL